MTIRVLVAPDSFKGTMTAVEVTAALGAGVEDAGGVALLSPLADGGEGTLEALATVVPGARRDVRATGPDGRAVTAAYLLSSDGTTAVVETASASGLHLVDPDTVDAYAATSRGTGEVIAAAVASGAQQILLGVGGSGCSDGGQGALEAIAEAGGLHDAQVRVLCDVTTPYEQAAAVYGPQKGADPAMVGRLTARLHDLAASYPRDPRGIPFTGAAGGLSGALWAVHDAELVSGIETVLALHAIDEKLEVADLVLTGEGRLDEQSAQGKVLDGLTRAARRHGVPVVAVVGRDDSTAETWSTLGLLEVIEAGDPETLRAAARNTTAAIAATPRTNQEVRTS
ncbi:glycerate 2-kinase [Aeromicrobium panaciterrae]|uniref:glycerate kinase n=1 Tax=Aeromicrobium panaciterrae TaxID=363861 RepID=UPI0031E1F99F